MALKKSQLYSPLWQSCDELRGGLPAPATMPERLSAAGQVAVFISVVPALPVSSGALEADFQPRPPDLPRALGPPLRLRI